MAECSHQRWQGRQTFTSEERRCLDCGEVIRRKIDRTAGEIPRLPWPELKEEDDNGRDTSPGPHRREVAAEERGLTDEGADLALLGERERAFIRKMLELP